jgi:hypothetical protein
MKQKKKNSVLEQVKAARKQSRDEEIQTHGKSINYRKVMASKKQYNRKKNKADDEVLPYFLFKVSEYYQILTRFSTGTNNLLSALIPKASYHA